MTLAQGMLPAWLVLPICGLVLVVIAGHVLGLHMQDMPPRRRRIRTACGLLMMFVTAMIAYALGIMPVPQGGAGGDGERGRAFVMVWTIIVGLLAMMIVLAASDALHTLMQALHDRRALRDELRSRVASDVGRHEQPSARKTGSDVDGGAARG
jgi:predicted nucleic acid-binding Zn ribbon protein